MTQGGEFEKEEPNAAAVAPQACLEPGRVHCMVLVGERREDGGEMLGFS